MSRCKSYQGPRRKKLPKVRYPSKLEAESAINELYKARPNDIHALQAYECDQCGSWHFGRYSNKKRNPLDEDRKKREAHEKHLVGILIGVLRGTYPGPPRFKKKLSMRYTRPMKPKKKYPPITRRQFIKTLKRVIRKTQPN